MPAARSRRRAGRGDDGVARPGGRSAADRGVLVHALLERLHFRRPLAPTTASVAAAAARTGIEPEPGPGESDELIALVRRFAESELCRRLGRATSVRREQRFSFALGDPVPGGSGQTIVTGALDVLAREPGGRSLVVDYKTDRLQRHRPVDRGARRTRSSAWSTRSPRCGPALTRSRSPIASSSSPMCP